MAKAKGKRELKFNPDFIHSKFKIVFWSQIKTNCDSKFVTPHLTDRLSFVVTTLEKKPAGR